MSRFPTARLPKLLLAAAAATAVSVAPFRAQAAPSVRIHVQAPVNTESPQSTKLSLLEHYGQKPVWQNTFAIPYDDLEKEIRKQLTALTKAPISGKETCEDPCPDVTWSVKVSPAFAFTKKKQPVLTKIGSSGEAKVRVSLDTQIRLDVHADVHAETWSDSADVPVDIFALIGGHAKVDVELWPEIEVSNLQLEFTLDDSNIDFELNGTAVILGAKYGSLLGGTPLGIMGGGPLALGSLLAVLGDAAADMAEDKIRQHLGKKAEELLETAHDEIQDLVKAELQPVIADANELRSDLLATKLPGVNKSLSELQDDLGMSVQLHTVTPSGNLAASAVLRMDGKAGRGRLRGEVRVPTQRCVYASGTGVLSGMKLPIGFEPANQHLDKQVGKSCSKALPSTVVGRRLYLGGDPEVALGAAATALPSWKNSPGSFSYEGTMTKTADWYACDFRVTSLPDAAIVELQTPDKLGRSLELRKDRNRWFVMTAGRTTVTLNENLRPKAEAVVGGKATCDSDANGADGPKLTPSKLKELADWIDDCPQCGRRIDKTGEVIYEIRDPEAFAKTPVGADRSRAPPRTCEGRRFARRRGRGGARR